MVMKNMQTEDKRPSHGQVQSKRMIWMLVFIIALLCFLIAVVGLILTFMPVKEDYSDYKNSSASKVSSTDTQAEEALADNPIDFAAVQADNPEVCAWIKVDGTNIDYPILRSGEDREEDYYLDHDISGKSKKAGAIYIQKINSGEFTDPNTVVYGHNMLNGSMFASLKKFRSTEFFNQNRKITVYTPGHILEYEIFSAFIYDNRHILNSFDFSDTESYQEFIDACLNPVSLTRNMLPGAEVTTEDRIITLSTCNGNKEQRYLVVGVLTDDTPTK